METIVDNRIRVSEGDLIRYQLPEGAPWLFESAYIRHKTTDASDFGPLTVRWEPYGNEFMYFLDLPVRLDGKTEPLESAEIVITINGGMIHQNIGFLGAVRIIPIEIDTFQRFGEIHQLDKAQLESLRLQVADAKFQLEMLRIEQNSRQDVIRDALLGLAQTQQYFGDLAVDIVTAKFLKRNFFDDPARALDPGVLSNPDLSKATAEGMSARIDVLLSLGESMKGLASFMSTFVRVGKELGSGLVDARTVQVLSEQSQRTYAEMVVVEKNIIFLQQKHEELLGVMVRTGYNPSNLAEHPMSATGNQVRTLESLSAVNMLNGQHDTVALHEIVDSGRPGDDLVIFTGSSKTLRAYLGDGFDTLVLQGFTKEQAYSSVKDNVIVITDGTRVVVGTDIERVKLQDAVLALDIGGNAGQSYRLYQAAFDRTPDTGGLSFWTNRIDTGTTLHNAAAHFISSVEFTASYGSLSTNAFVDQIYKNVLGRSPDQGGLEFWTTKLNSGDMDRAGVLVGFSESQENVNLVAEAIKDGIWLI